MATYRVPGVYQEDVFPPPTPVFLTGVPVFLGYAAPLPGTDGPAVNLPVMLNLWSQFGTTFGVPPADGYLAYAVRGFFENGGLVCYVVRLADDLDRALPALRAGLAATEVLDTVDLVCAPDITRAAADPLAVAALQGEVLDHCRRMGDRFAILDTLPAGTIEAVLEQRGRLASADGALYHPWVSIPGPASGLLAVPPCGHIAGVYARSDQQTGVHKAPANEMLEGVLDLQADLSPGEQERLYAEGVNELRAFTGRGIRVWGARTLSDDPAWRYVNVRRLLLTTGRWLTRFMAGLTFEPNNSRIWMRIMRELTAYFEGLFQQGALKGSMPDQAFYVKCDAATNPPEARQAGIVITEIGLAPAVPGEFIVARIIHGASGVSIEMND
jgi:uncharacterized protein